jgi:Outer membrane lipoprotein-sorting protein
MSRLFIFLISLFLNTGAGNDTSTSQLPAGSAESRGAWLAQKIEDRDTGRDSRISLRMRLFDRQNRVRERALTMLTLRGGPGRPVPADRSLLRFTQPADISGTSFLVWKQAGSDDERFLYLPSLGRVRRIAGAEAQESFVGSDFTYEDIGGREFDKYDYRLLTDDARWTSPDGVVHPAFSLESRRRDTTARFPRVVSLVRKDNFVVVHADIYNKRDESQKTFDAKRVERVGTYWTVLEMVMVDAVQHTRTELAVEKAEYDIGLKPEAFSRRELEQGRMPAAATGRDVR